MSIATIQRLALDTGTRTVPPAGSYRAASERWIEAEYHAQLPDTSSMAAYWEGEPGWVRIDDWPYHEVCVILSGRVAVEDAHGARIEFSAGESFVIPRGFSGTWHTLEPTRKIFVGIDPTMPAEVAP